MRGAWIGLLIFGLAACDEAESPQGQSAPDASSDVVTVAETAPREDAAPEVSTEDAHTEVAIDAAPEVAIDAGEDAASDVREAGPTELQILQTRCEAGAPRLQWQGGECFDTRDLAYCDYRKAADGKIRCVPRPLVGLHGFTVGSAPVKCPPAVENTYLTDATVGPDVDVSKSYVIAIKPGTTDRYAVYTVQKIARPQAGNWLNMECAGGLAAYPYPPPQTGYPTIATAAEMPADAFVAAP